jgi:hypothetical protein
MNGGDLAAFHRGDMVMRELSLQEVASVTGGDSGIACPVPDKRYFLIDDPPAYEVPVEFEIDARPIVKAQ